MVGNVDVKIKFFIIFLVNRVQFLSTNEMIFECTTRSVFYQGVELTIAIAHAKDQACQVPSIPVIHTCFEQRGHRI